MSTKGYIYLLKLGDTNNRIIYKVEKSINVYKKKNNYAEILIFIISNDITNDENEIIKLFNINCKLDKGRKFFLAQNDLFVLNLFLNYFINKNNSEINESSEIIKCNKTCPTCKTIFKYPSRLKIHLETTIHCKKTPEFIKNYFLTIKKQKINSLTNDTTSINNSEINESNLISVQTNNNNNIEINESNESNEIIKCNKTCPTCKTIFKYSSRLKVHLENTIHCKKTPEFIKNYFLTIKKQKINSLTNDTTSKINIFKCDKCINSYTLLQNLVKHKKKLKCYKYN